MIKLKIYLVRHGETEWNKLKKWQGHTDIELSETGMDQVNNLADTIGDYSNISVVYASPLARAYKTAEILNEVLNKEIVVREGLKEIRLGSWEGMDYETVITNYPTDYNLWQTGAEGLDISLNVESLPVLRERAFLELEALRKMNDSDFMIVGHGAWISSLLQKLTNKTNNGLWHIENAKIIEVHFSAETGQYYLITDLECSTWNI